MLTRRHDISHRREPSGAMSLYLASDPSTTSERLVEGNIMSDEEIMRNLKQKEAELDALVRQAMEGSSSST